MFLINIKKYEKKYNDNNIETIINIQTKILSFITFSISENILYDIKYNIE